MHTNSFIARPESIQGRMQRSLRRKREPRERRTKAWGESKKFGTRGRGGRKGIACLPFLPCPSPLLLFFFVLTVPVPSRDSRLPERKRKDCYACYMQRRCEFLPLNHVLTDHVAIRVPVQSRAREFSFPLANYFESFIK